MVRLLLWTVTVAVCCMLRFSTASNTTAKLTPADYMLCGGLSTALTDLLLFPVDTIKVTQQSSKEIMSSSKALNQVLKSGGIPALYKGALGYATVDGLGGALFFSVYESVKRNLAERYKLTGTALSMSLYGAAGAAFVASSVFIVPGELLKARMQTQGFRSLGHCIRDAVAKERGGFFGLYTGYTATLVRDMPYFAFQLGFYDNIKDFLTSKLQEQQQFKQQQQAAAAAAAAAAGAPADERKVRRWPRLPFPRLPRAQLRMTPATVDLVSSLTSGLLTGFLTNPMDVVTARLMTQKADFAKQLLPAFRPSVGAPYRGMMDCITRMAREEGPRGFLIGVKARVSWIAPFVVVSLGLNNYLKTQLLAVKTQQQLNQHHQQIKKRAAQARVAARVSTSASVAGVCHGLPLRVSSSWADRLGI